MKAGGSLLPPSHKPWMPNSTLFIRKGRLFSRSPLSKWLMSPLNMQRNNLTHDDIRFLVPHQANMRIIEATARRMEIGKDQVMINIEKYGNTTAATIPLCLCDYEKQLKKGDNIILTSFGAGFTWGAIYVKWAYDPK
jgi:3-oxoacyl-[acyl-carrier-protein] synthase-3